MPHEPRVASEWPVLIIDRIIIAQMKSCNMWRQPRDHLIAIESERVGRHIGMTDIDEEAEIRIADRLRQAQQLIGMRHRDETAAMRPVARRKRIILDEE